MQEGLCPGCGANVAGLTERCDCCGASLARKETFLFFSTVAWHTSASILMDILRPVENAFALHYGEEVFSEALDQIAVIPLCFPAEMHENPEISRERRYVSLKNRYRDLRLHICYEALIHGDPITRIRLCFDNIVSAAAYVRKKDRTFQEKAFLDAVSDCFYRSYGVRIWE